MVQFSKALCKPQYLDLAELPLLRSLCMQYFLPSPFLAPPSVQKSIINPVRIPKLDCTFPRFYGFNKPIYHISGGFAV